MDTPNNATDAPLISRHLLRRGMVVRTPDYVSDFGVTVPTCFLFQGAKPPTMRVRRWEWESGETWLCADAEGSLDYNVCDYPTHFEVVRVLPRSRCRAGLRSFSR